MLEVFNTTLCPIIPLILGIAVAQTLTSNPDGHDYCGSSEVVFTCETRGSEVLTWKGDNFYLRSPIGLAGEIRTVNYTVRSSSNNNTVVTLTYNSLDGDVCVLKSTLRIIAQSRAPSGFVTCECVCDNSTSKQTRHFRVNCELHDLYIDEKKT